MGLTKAANVQTPKGNVIICPGGGYRWISPREAQPVADAFAANGWQPWILFYSVAISAEPLGDVPLRQAAMAVAKLHAETPQLPVILCGFSAGGHLAASVGVHWNDENRFSKGIQKAVRPEALILCYPVITAGEFSHEDSICALAGADREQADKYNVVHFVNSETPPTFLWATAADETVPVQNSFLFASALLQHRVPFEMHVYPDGVHGLSLATKQVEEPAKNRFADAHVATWFPCCIEWLERFAT